MWARLQKRVSLLFVQQMLVAVLIAAVAVSGLKHMLQHGKNSCDYTMSPPVSKGLLLVAFIVSLGGYLFVLRRLDGSWYLTTRKCGLGTCLALEHAWPVPLGKEE
jgi:hypothetical protein